MADSETNQTSASPNSDRNENSIRPSAKRRKEGNAETPAPVAATPSQTSAKPTHAVPAEVRDRFVVVKNKYYFHDGTRAFTDRGTRLTTASENTEVIRSLIQIAGARGWSEITVRGTERFRKEAWFAAHLAGLEVHGYRPSEFEHGRVVRGLSRQGPEPTEDSVTLGERPLPAEPAIRSRRREELLAGRLLHHGPATYHHDPHAPLSYFVKLESLRGERTIWGVDLERAFQESLTKPQSGDEIGLRAVRQEAVKVRTRKRDGDGGLIERELDTLRNRWIVEKRSFFDARTEAASTVRDPSIDPRQAVKQHPELVGTYLQVRAAELAAKRFHDPEDRERFVQSNRAALADSVARGEPLPAVRLRERAPTRAPPTPEREPAPVRS